ncbi:MAG: hypothetical protein QM611_01605, partial [Microbacterium sp.]
GAPGGGGSAPEGGGSDGGQPPSGGGMPSGAPDGAAPSGAPDGTAPSGAPGGGGQRTVGKVTAVTETSLTVEATAQDDSTSSTEVAIDSDTVVTATVDATADDIEKGLCVTAMGTADETGGYDATSLTLSDPDDEGECSTGSGRPEGGQGPGGGQGGDGGQGGGDQSGQGDSNDS